MTLVDELEDWIEDTLVDELESWVEDRLADELVWAEDALEDEDVTLVDELESWVEDTLVVELESWVEDTLVVELEDWVAETLDVDEVNVSELDWLERLVEETDVPDDVEYELELEGVVVPDALEEALDEIEDVIPPDDVDVWLESVLLPDALDWLDTEDGVEEETLPEDALEELPRIEELPPIDVVLEDTDVGITLEELLVGPDTPDVVVL